MVRRRHDPTGFLFSFLQTEDITDHSEFVRTTGEKYSFVVHCCTPKLLKLSSNRLLFFPSGIRNEAEKKIFFWKIYSDYSDYFIDAIIVLNVF